MAGGQTDTRATKHHLEGNKTARKISIDKGPAGESIQTVKNEAMRTSNQWREHLLGSLLGQLQLATYTAVFIGFSGASISGLWLTQRSQALSGDSALRMNAKQLESELLNEGLLVWSADETADTRAQRELAIRKTLVWHSSKYHTHWIEQPDGRFLLPINHTRAIDPELPSNVASVVTKPGVAETMRANGLDYIAILNRIYPTGQKIWSTSEVTTLKKAQSAFLNWMIVIWGSCLVVSLWTVNRLVRRIIRPLQQLTEASAGLTAETLVSSVVTIDNAPLEVSQLASTYNALRGRLAKSWNDQRRFVSAVSHELRTPLTIIQCYVHSTLKRSTNLSESQRKGLRTAEEESVRMRYLLDDLLDLSRSDCGQLKLNNEPMPIGLAVREAVDLARCSLDRKINLIQPPGSEAPDAWIALADPDRLRQVLLDLLENAHKYSAGGEPITVTLSEANHMAIVAVADQGIGIPEDDLDKVFERFHRGANASISGGSGLGLSIVKMLVEAMAGSVSVKSTVNQGSTFTVMLPLRQDQGHVVTNAKATNT